MQPRIGAISGWGLLFIALATCALGGARVALAVDADAVGAAPGPRPQAIASRVVEETEDERPDAADAVIEGFVEELEASDVVVDDSSGIDAPAGESKGAPAQNPEPAVQSSDAERALGLPLPAAHESHHIAGEAQVEPGALGSFDPRTNEMVRVVGALAVVIGLILLLRAAARRLGGPMLDGGRPSGVLLVLARYPIARGQSLVLLKLGRRLLLCHQAKGAMATLCEIEHEDEVAAMLARIEAGSRGRDAARFEKMLEDFNQEHRRRANSARGDSADMRRAIAEAQVVDLTKRGGSGGWLRLRRAAS